MGRSILVLGVVAALLSSGADVSRAGGNAGGQARLSWGYQPLVCVWPPGESQICIDDLAGVPRLSFPLYLLLNNAPDIRELAVDLRWTPSDSLGPCYGFVGASIDTGCGWATAVPPLGGFNGDFTFTWSIVFPPLSSKRCVVYWVSNACDSATPANFCLASVRTRDSAGAIDTLALVGNATILSGTGEECPGPEGIKIDGVLPTEIVAGQPATLEVRGEHFASGARVKLRRGVTVVSASSVTVPSKPALRLRLFHPHRGASSTSRGMPSTGAAVSSPISRFCNRWPCSTARSRVYTAVLTPDSPSSSTASIAPPACGGS